MSSSTKAINEKKAFIERARRKSSWNRWSRVGKLFLIASGVLMGSGSLVGLSKKGTAGCMSKKKTRSYTHFADDRKGSRHKGRELSGDWQPHQTVEDDALFASEGFGVFWGWVRLPWE